MKGKILENGEVRDKNKKYIFFYYLVSTRYSLLSTSYFKQDENYEYNY